MAALQAAIPADFQVFALEGFDAQSYANAVINNEPYHPQPSTSTSAPASAGLPNGAAAVAPPLAGTGITTTGGDVSAALAKLNIGIEDLNRQLRSEVTTHHPSLLNKAASISSLEEALRSVRKGLAEVETSISRLQKKIALPYETLDAALAKLDRLQRAAELCRKVARFVGLARRLEGQMQQLERGGGLGADAAEEERQERRERALAEAALTLAELDSVLVVSAPSSSASAEIDKRPPSIRELRAIRGHLDVVDAARQSVEEEMESMIGQGLVKLDQALLASSLQTAYNLSVLPGLVASLITDLTEAVTGRIRIAFDVSAIAREVSSKESSTTSAFMYKSRARTEPTPVTLPQWTSALWTRLESLIDDMTGCCVKVYTLERVLEWKKDAVTGTPFLEEAMKGELKERPRVVFWTTLARVFEKEARQASGSSTFVQQSLTNSYPRLLRLFHDFFARIAVHTSTVYTTTAQSPETVLLLRAVHPFEAMYISRAAQRLSDAIGQSLARCSAPTQGMTEGQAVARALGNELDAARFDPLLLTAVARKVKEAGLAFVARLEAAAPSDYASRSMLGPVATPSQLQNAEFASALSHFSVRLSRLLLHHDFPPPVVSLVTPAATAASSLCETIISSLTAAMRRELSSILARMHRLDFSKPSTSASDGGMGHGASGYMNDLTSKLAFIRKELLLAYRLAPGSRPSMRDWVLGLARHVLGSFVINASLVVPLGEMGKLKLTTDMSELEFGLANLAGLAGVGGGTQLAELIGEEWRALRGFRQLLFVDKEVLLIPPEEGGPADHVPPIVVLHHLAVRARGEGKKMDLPNERNGWSQAEYVKWLEDHPSEPERVELFAQGLRDGGVEAGEWAKAATKVAEEAKAQEE